MHNQRLYDCLRWFVEGWARICVAERDDASTLFSDHQCVVSRLSYCVVALPNFLSVHLIPKLRKQHLRGSNIRSYHPPDQDHRLFRRPLNTQNH
jgi:hypothetical protein